MICEYIIRVDDEKKDIMGNMPLQDKPQELVRCKDCEYSYTEGFVHPHLICEKHPELEPIPDDWFCADGWKA